MTPPDRNERIDREFVDAIGSLGNRHRLQILLALAAEEREQRQQWHTMTFTELYEAVDVESSSQFSYHLDRLVGQFVDRVPDGYRLTYSGHKIVRAILSDVYESTTAFEDRAVPGACPICEATSLVATLEDEQFLVRCSACDSTLVTDFFPRSQARNRTPSAVVESFGHRIWSTYVQVRGDVCPECYGSLDTTVEARERGRETQYVQTSSCPQCWYLVSMPVEAAVAFHPAVVGAFWDAGVSLLDLPLWEFFQYMTSDVMAVDVVSEEPFEARWEVTLAGEKLHFRVDDAATVTQIACENG